MLLGAAYPPRGPLRPDTSQPGSPCASCRSLLPAAPLAQEGEPGYWGANGAGALAGWLETVGLERLLGVMTQHEVDWVNLSLLGPQDLLDMVSAPCGCIYIIEYYNGKKGRRTSLIW
eukprot:961599-Pyramimonas_sp.AAC.1